MPEMTGLEALPEIRKLFPKIPIIMFSTLTERGAEATLDALALGASDYVTKPSNLAMGAASESISRELIPKIKALCHIPVSARTSTAGAEKKVPRIQQSEIRFRPASRRSTRPGIIAIGVSTGGPDALARLLPVFPERFPLPVVIAQHMPAIFTTMLAKRLAAKCSLPVRECQSGELLEPSCIWIAPGDFHMVVQRRKWQHPLAHTQGAARKFLPAFGGRAVPFGGRSLWRECLGRHSDGHGARWSERMPGPLRGRVFRDRPGRGQQRRLGHARFCRPLRTGRKSIATRPDRRGNQSSRRGSGAGRSWNLT